MLRDNKHVRRQGHGGVAVNCNSKIGLFGSSAVIPRSADSEIWAEAARMSDFAMAVMQVVTGQKTGLELTACLYNGRGDSQLRIPGFAL